ncbi:MAG: hypothetical protein ACRDGA_11805, partial [Bacteroidota bacterium]
LTEYSAEGRLYRVDLRLRPEGTVGPIVLSRAAYMRYYETRGELWERQMLTKARAVAGNVKVGNKLLEELGPFIYPRTHAGKPLDEIAAIKRKIESKTDEDANIKLGSGGIRDVEFIVQALQLLNGGTNERLREKNTLLAVEGLREYSLLSKREKELLVVAYKFFRSVEHRLQLLYGMQTHSLPQSKEEREFLSRRLGFRSESGFHRKLETHRTQIRRIFSSVFGLRKGRGIGATTAGLASEKILKESGFLNVRKATEHFGRLLEHLPELREAKLIRRFLQSVKKTKAPDWGLQNFLLLLNNPSLRRSLLQTFQNAQSLELLVLVCARSRRCAELLSREPLLFETLLAQPEEILSDRIGWEFFRKND